MGKFCTHKLQSYFTYIYLVFSYIHKEDHISILYLCMSCWKIYKKIIPGGVLTE